MNNFDLEIQLMIEEFGKIYEKFIPLKQGPVKHKIKINLISKGVFEGKSVYIKSFTEKGKNAGQNELELIKILNNFSKLKGSPIGGPEIYSFSDSPYFHFVMEDLYNNGFEEINFTTFPMEKLNDIYFRYREEFDKFELYSRGKYNTEKNLHLQKIITNLKNNSQLSSGELYSIQKSMSFQIEDDIKFNLNRSYHFVDAILGVEKSTMLAKLKTISAELIHLQFEYTFGRFWTGHILIKGDNIKLLDLDNIGYQIKGTEYLSLIRSNLLMNVENFDSYEGWRSSFEKWYTIFKDIAGGNKDILLFKKLFSTIYFDYGHLMINVEENRERLIKKGIDPLENAKKGIIWNGMLLKELFDI